MNENDERRRIDDLVLDPLQRRVYRGRRRLPLSPLSYATLRALVEHAPRVVSSETLIAAAWNGAVVSDETVVQRIRLLRRALGDTGRNSRYIETVRGRGYRLVPLPEPAGRPFAGVVPLLAGLALAASVVIPALVWILESAHPGESPVAVQVAAPLTADAQRLSERAYAYLARHQRDDNLRAVALFRAALAQTPGLRSARLGLSQALSQRASKFNGTQQDARTAEALARAALAEQVDAEAELALATGLDAQGRVDEAIEHYRAALKLDPSHEAATASLAYLYQIRGELAKALELNMALLEQGSEGPYLRLQVAECLRLLGFTPVAEQWLERIERLNPDNVFAAPARAAQLVALGREEEALAVVERARALGSRRVELALIEGRVALARGQTRRARKAFDQARHLDPEHGEAGSWLLVADALQGQGDARAYRQRAAGLEQAVAQGETWPGVQLQLVILHAAFGDERQALSALDRLLALGYRDEETLRGLPGLGRLRQNPGFRQRMLRLERDLSRQRDQVLAAHWMPRSLLATRE